MSELMAFIVSPTGIALYIGFWILKLAFGAWVIGKALLLLPERTRERLTNTYTRLRGQLLRRARDIS